MPRDLPARTKSEAPAQGDGAKSFAPNPKAQDVSSLRATSGEPVVPALSLTPSSPLPVCPSARPAWGAEPHIAHAAHVQCSGLSQSRAGWKNCSPSMKASAEKKATQRPGLSWDSVFDRQRFSPSR